MIALHRPDRRRIQGDDPNCAATAAATIEVQGPYSGNAQAMIAKAIRRSQGGSARAAIDVAFI